MFNCRTEIDNLETKTPGISSVRLTAERNVKIPGVKRAYCAAAPGVVAISTLRSLRFSRDDKLIVGSAV